MKISVEDAYHVGQMVMGRASRRLGVIHPGSPEDKRFRGYFGVSAEVAIEAWEMMIEHDYLPPSPHFFIICGHLHSCGCTQQMIRLYLWHWEGVTQRQFASIFGQ